MDLTEDDVFTLLGHAAVLHGDGQRDMPAYFFGLAERIALALGDAAMAQRVHDVASKTQGGEMAKRGEQQGMAAESSARR